MARARGTLRPGSRTSSATYEAAFHPEVREHYGNECEEPALEHDVAALRQIFGTAVAEREAKRDEEQQRRHFQRREDVADQASRAHTAQVHPRHAVDCGERHHGLRRDTYRQRAWNDRNGEERRAVAGTGKEASEIGRQDDRRRGYGARESGNERRPAAEKRREPAERLAQVDVFAAGTRTQGGELRIGHRPRKCQQPASRPRGQEWQGRRNGSGDLRRGEQDSATDDVGNDESSGVEGTEAALENAFVGCRHECGDYTGGLACIATKSVPTGRLAVGRRARSGRPIQ